MVDDAIWAAGGHDFSAVLRYAHGLWTSTAVPPLLNFVVGISEREAIVGGEGGALGHTTDGGATWQWTALEGGWLICASRDDDGRVWIGQEGGIVYRAEAGTAKFAKVAQLEADTINAVRRVDRTHGIVVTERSVFRIELATGKLSILFSADRPTVIDGVCDPATGRVVIVSAGGRGWRCETTAVAGTKFESIDLGVEPTYDFDAVFWVAGWFTALGYDGALHISRDGRQWKRVVVEKKVKRLGGIAPYKGGWVVGALRIARGSQVGTISFLGDPAAAPVRPVRATGDPPSDLTAVERAARFVIAERYALAWATTWRELPDAESQATHWMEIAAKLGRVT